MKTNGRAKYTFDVLNNIVSKSSSYKDVLQALGLRRSGGNHSYIKRRMLELGISYAHFQSSRVISPHLHKGSSGKLKKEAILVLNRNQGKREKLPALRRAMTEYGFKEECSECGSPPIWNGKPLRLQIDHRNGDFCDNRPDNLRFICPNCHCQTDTWGVNRNFYVTLKRKFCASGETADTEGLGPSVPQGQMGVQVPPRVQKESSCLHCGKNFIKKPKRIGFCSYQCHRISREKIEWPSDSELSVLVKNNSILSLSKKLGVSGNAITKRCKLRSIMIDSKWTLRLGVPPRVLIVIFRMIHKVKFCQVPELGRPYFLIRAYQLEGVHTSGSTIDEALQNIREAIACEDDTPEEDCHKILLMIEEVSYEEWEQL